MVCIGIGIFSKLASVLKTFMKEMERIILNYLFFVMVWFGFYNVLLPGLNYRVCKEPTNGPKLLKERSLITLKYKLTTFLFV